MTTGKLNDGAVTSSKIADGTITAADIDPAGGVYSSKSQIYLTYHESVVAAHDCGYASTSCEDANDLPLSHVYFWKWTDEVGRPFFEFTNWMSETGPANFLLYLCVTGDENAQLSVYLFCISVPGP